MLYYQVKEIKNEISVLCSSKIELYPNDVVVIPDYNNDPITGRVEKVVPPYQVLVSPIQPIEIIDKVNIKLKSHVLSTYECTTSRNLVK